MRRTYSGQPMTHHTRTRNLASCSSKDDSNNRISQHSNPNFGRSSRGTYFLMEEFIWAANNRKFVNPLMPKAIFFGRFSCNLQECLILA
jgi:hypothetical protein